ncbi:MAG: cupin domain-containing protein [Caldicoprobacter oshimai]|uniref:Cupin domain-containing protein n=1 Tax=Caldicoprobacter faecalis TaxID=937334 RepID=A0A1I5RVG5_9FIRM|nr:cupin domain-containing protein [Caldicoprobacter faecalis]PZN12175.1 MAG: cupin domain-containing protein [Caldicoprobacter oshimai]SFP62241.1 Cupin domain-containing protein [Caldicoprobacter faecalis]
MIIKAHEMEVELRERMRGGNGTVKITHIGKEQLPAKTRLFAKITLEKGCSIGFHQHANETEMFYFLKGRGKVDDNGTTHYVQAGDAMFTGGGKGHSVENCGDEPLELLAVIVLD